MADPYFKGLAKFEREPSCQPISKLEFEFERRRVTKEDIRELIFREILEYHPQLLKDYLAGNDGMNFLYPRFSTLPFKLTYLLIIFNLILHDSHIIMDFSLCSAIGHFRQQFAYLEENDGKSGPVIPPQRKHTSLPRLVHSFN